MICMKWSLQVRSVAFRGAAGKARSGGSRTVATNDVKHRHRSLGGGADVVRLDELGLRRRRNLGARHVNVLLVGGLPCS
jgi:hypothetical protein